jgi:general stress protein 26
LNSIETQKQRLFELIGNFDAGMLVIEPAGANLLVKPVRVVELEGGVAVLAAMDDTALGEIADGTSALILFQGGSTQRFAWLRGETRIVRRRAEIEAKWNETWRDWFPGGPEDPALCLVVLAGTEGEYWDRRQSGGLADVLARARALLVGGEIAEPSPPHGKVKLAGGSLRQRRTSRKRARAEAVQQPTNAPGGTILTRDEPALGAVGAREDQSAEP